MIKLSDAINELLNTTNKNFLLGNIQFKWEQIIGKNIAQATEPVKIENKTIYIKCKTPSWRQEINFQKREMLKKIQNNTNKINKIILI